MAHLFDDSACASFEEQKRTSQAVAGSLHGSCRAGTDPGSWYKAVANTDSELSKSAEDMVTWDPYQDQRPKRSASDLRPRANESRKLDLLTAKAMPNQALARHLKARGCTYQRLRQRGMDLWQTQTITMDDEDRKAAKSHLEWRLSNKDIANCVGIFRQVLQGHEEELFQRSLFMFVAMDREENSDQVCIEEAIRKLANLQPVLDRKRKRDQMQCQDQGLGAEAKGSGSSRKPKKSRRQLLPNFERLVLLLGLAGVSQARVTELGVMPDLLQFLFHLLGGMVFSIFQEDLCTQASAYMVLRKKPTGDPENDAPSRPEGPDTKRSLVDAFQEVVECHSQNFTAFQRRHRVRQLEDAVSLAEMPQLAQVFYDHLESNELEAWSHKLHALGHEELWRPM